MDFSRDFEERHYQIPEYLTEINTQFNNALMRVVTAADELYLDGISVFDVVQHNFLPELYNITGYGLCYESAAIAMMLLKDVPSARLMLGTGECKHSTHERTDHAWVEFEEDRIPFVVDFAWFEHTFCVPRIVQVDINKTIVYHTYTYEQFWQLSLSKKLYALCHNPKTSYVLPWLFLYRSRRKKYAFCFEESAEIICRSKVAPTGEYRQFMYFLDSIMEEAPAHIPAELRYVAT